MSVCHSDEWWSAVCHTTEWVPAVCHSIVWRTFVCVSRMGLDRIASAYRSNRVHTNICSHTRAVGCNRGPNG
jgi:hypothetical protein